MTIYYLKIPVVPISYTREPELQGGIQGPQSQSQLIPLSSALSARPSHVTAVPVGLLLGALLDP